MVFQENCTSVLNVTQVNSSPVSSFDFNKHFQIERWTFEQDGSPCFLLLKESVQESENKTRKGVTYWPQHGGLYNTYDNMFVNTKRVIFRFSLYFVERMHVAVLEVWVEVWQHCPIVWNRETRKSAVCELYRNTQIFNAIRPLDSFSIS